MVKSASLKCSGVWIGFGEPTFPETNPALDGEFEIAWRAEQMQMIGHEKIIANEPCRGGVLPDFMQCVLDRGLCQPSSSFLGADGEEDPVRSTERSMDAFGRRAASRVAKWSLAHAKFPAKTWLMQKILVREERELCPTDQYGRAALPRRLKLFTEIARFETHHAFECGVALRLPPHSAPHSAELRVRGFDALFENLQELP
jgi:hypothetical protein